MKYLLGLSKNCNGFPSICPQPSQGHSYGFGMVTFPLENHKALIFKNIHTDKDTLKGLYTDKEYGSATFIGCYEELPCPFEEDEIQPYTYHYAGRDWVLACSAHLQADFREILPIENTSIFVPTSTAAEEYVLCWLLHEIHACNASSVEELTWQILHRLFQQLNALGSIDLIFSDGKSLITYHDSQDKTPLYMLYSAPPHKLRKFDFDRIKISLDHLDLNQTLILFTNQKISAGQGHFQEMYPGQMIAIKHGEYLWDSHQQENKSIKSIPKTDFVPPTITPSNPLVLQHISMRPLLSLADKNRQSPGCAAIVTHSKDPPTFYSILHESSYHYDAPVNISKHVFHLQPVHDLTQSILDYKLLSSVNGTFHNFTGVFGNTVTRFDISEPYTTLILQSHSLVVNHSPRIDLEELSHQQWRLPLNWMPWDHAMLQAYLMPPELPESELLELSEYAMSFVQRNNNCLLSILDDLNYTIHRDYTYLSGSTTLHTTPYDVYVSREGVCQDFANLFICLARLLNIPSRYRVGYIFTGGEYENKEQGDATHAWVEVYLPGAGWMGFDPTNSCHEGKNHIRVATGRNFRDATPTSGTIYSGGGYETLTTVVQMIQLTPKEADEIMIKNISLSRSF